MAVACSSFGVELTDKVRNCRCSDAASGHGPRERRAQSHRERERREAKEKAGLHHVPLCLNLGPADWPSRLAESTTGRSYGRRRPRPFSRCARDHKRAPITAKERPGGSLSCRSTRERASCVLQHPQCPHRQLKSTEDFLICIRLIIGHVSQPCHLTSPTLCARQMASPVIDRT